VCSVAPCLHACSQTTQIMLVRPAAALVVISAANSARHTGDAAVPVQVSDAALAALMSMGHGRRLAARALRFSGGDVARASDFCLEHGARAAGAAAQDARARELTDQQRERGRTVEGQWIDVEGLQQLEQLGYPLMLAAEALRCARTLRMQVDTALCTFNG
jgi:hypothetical protein